MPTNTKIPKFSDREVITSLLGIAQELGDIMPLRVFVNIPLHGMIRVEDGWEDLPHDQPLGLLIAQNSSVASQIQMRAQGEVQLVSVDRGREEPFDTLRIEDDWHRHLPNVQGNDVPHFHIRLTALCRKHFKASEVDASLYGDPTNAWTKYRNAQIGALQALEKTAQDIITNVAEKNAEIDKLRSERFEKLEAQLREELAAERERLQTAHDAKMAEIESREKAHADKESQFLTKEARYVSRQKQDEQIKQIQDWLSDWGLTKGTTKKRWPVTAVYVAAMAVTGGITLYATKNNYDLIHSTDDLAKLAWWQWVALASKSFFPLAAFTTFAVYLIRWTSSWAKQHSEEEFRNRSRLIDIGRAGWLLEAVRDAHEKNAEIPTDLLRELSRNLFAHSTGTDSDIHPSAVSDLLLQGLTTLRVKTGDTEVEASRVKGKKSS